MTIFTGNPTRSNWNVRIRITPYNQEHLLSSQAQQGQARVITQELKDESTVSVAQQVLWWEQGQNRINQLWFACLLSCLLYYPKDLQPSSARVWVCTQNYTKHVLAPENMSNKAKWVPRYSHCKKLTSQKMHILEHCRTLCNPYLWKNCFRKKIT